MGGKLQYRGGRRQNSGLWNSRAKRLLTIGGEIRWNTKPGNPGADKLTGHMSHSGWWQRDNIRPTYGAVDHGEEVCETPGEGKGAHEVHIHVLKTSFKDCEWF